jgi:hypothetical protein
MIMTRCGAGSGNGIEKIQPTRSNTTCVTKGGISDVA